MRMRYMQEVFGLVASLNQRYVSEHFPAELQRELRAV